MPNPHKYYKTMGELINHYVPFDDNEPHVQALIHAYELGAMHHSEEEDYELAEFNSSWEEEEKFEREGKDGYSN